MEGIDDCSPVSEITLGKMLWVWRGETLFLLLSLAECCDEVLGETRPCYNNRDISDYSMTKRR